MDVSSKDYWGLMKSRGMWLYLTYLLFPVPAVLLIMLSLPLPEFAKSPVRKVTLKVTDIIFYKFPVGPIRSSIYQLALGLSTVLLFLTVSDVSSKNQIADNLSYYEAKSQRWRAERNFWIAVLAFSMWLILGRFIAVTREAERYKDIIRKSEKIR